MKTYVVYFKNELVGCGKEFFYFDLNKNMTTGYANPDFATQFDTQKSARSFAKENLILECKTIQLSLAIDDFKKWVNSGCMYRKIKMVNKELNIRYNPKIHTKCDILKWRISEKNGDVLYDVYKTWPDLYQVFDHLHDVCAYRANSKNAKLNYTFSMFIKPNSSLEKFEEELNLILPSITLLDKDGNKVIDIFDHFLSEGGNSVNFIVHKDGKYSISSRWGNNIEPTEDLDKVLEYWRRERYYN